MRRLSAILLGTLLAAAGVASSAPQSGTSGEDAAPQASPKPGKKSQRRAAAKKAGRKKRLSYRLNGWIERIDPESSAITVKTKTGKLVDLSVAAGAKFTKGGNRIAITLADVKVGNRVRVTHKAGKASNIHVKVRKWRPRKKTAKKPKKQ